jgi:hypothetical protein
VPWQWLDLFDIPIAPGYNRINELNFLYLVFTKLFLADPGFISKPGATIQVSFIPYIESMGPSFR